MKGLLAEFDSEHSYFQPCPGSPSHSDSSGEFESKRLGRSAHYCQYGSRSLSKKLGRNYIKSVYQKLDWVTG
ncbi:hypothetical protein DQG23_35815 [Paenibacillus contaminans]|uniref:Uncharacterized protein n=1 Tax=Paenibacillus contaminans TaxID=450362 RepID=A0A329LVK5_9BACL|nr:hypothetical protein DQG23_35815 [Paenibacillus contaminans]